ncbi:hypothetical protein [Apilactobacillus timberlakei]|uniref:Secreted protein n=1 Tax=Apilactobacillus timberlakei TaxID=2008380 RepID=A0ABY2YSZ1_9LACO|nr:hypothetical protein [Apilactobacillus timberlakei]TPR13292.1 hypothetical protein DYZ97_05230 [Apilactobacillus timberlakei]TPR14337.1 hypothetical protein DY048_05155 [Apilactobacillus timberlakei]TPR16590.1 hypothetical protein DY052_03245 [Apilactobacillus timberlakei]
MLKKLITALSIVLMSLSFSYGAFTTINSSSNNVYAARKHHKENDTDEGFWQKIWDAIKDVQE